MPAFLTLDDLDVRGKRVLVRADLNVPMKDGTVSDATRLERLAPTIDELARKGARIILLSHFGRPEGKPVPRYSLEPLVPALAQALGGRKVAFAHDCVGPEAKAVAARLADGEVALLENLRFEPGEEANDPAFAQALASLGELYVDDAFSCAHRAHASVAALAHLLPAAAGRLMAAELGYLARVLEAPARPLAAIVGGAKVSTKLELLGNLIAKVDLLIIGGGMANSFLAAQGIEVGRSLAEHGLAAAANAILARAAARNCAILLPTDAVVAARLEAGAAARTVAIGAVPAEAMILDIGPATAARPRRAHCTVPHAGVERTARRVRDPALRCRDERGGARGGGTDQGREARERGRGRRHGCGPPPRRRRRGLQLCLDRGWGLPRMARGPGAARGRGPRCCGQGLSGAPSEGGARSCLARSDGPK